MNSAQILGYPLLLIAVLELFLGLILLKQNPRKSRASRAAAACAIAAALWSLSAALMYIRLSQGMGYLVFARFSWIGWFTVPTAIQTVLFLSDEESRKARIVGLVLYPFWAIVLGLSLFTDLIVRDGYVPIPFSNDPGPIEMPLRLIGSAMAFWMIYEIFRLRRKVTGYRRAQLSYYLYGTTFFGTGGAVVGGFLQVFTGHGLEPSLSAYFSFPWVLMIFYSITRFRLFDIRLVVSRAVFILFLSFSISALQYALFKVLEPVAGAVASIFISVPVIGILFFGTPLSRYVQRWINELMIGQRYGYQTMLKESAAAMITILQRDELLRFIVDSVRRGLGVDKVCLVLQEGAGGAASRVDAGGDSGEAERCELSPEAFRQLGAKERPVLREELEASAGSGERDLVSAMHGMGAALVVPLRSKGQSLAMLVLGDRTSGDPYLQSDLDVLETVSNYAAVAIENARLFAEAGQMRASLREQEGIFRTLAQTLPAAIFIHRGGKFLYANPAGVQMTGYPMVEILDMEFWELVHPEYRQVIRERAQERIRGSEAPAQYEFKIVRKDGAERWVLLSAGLIEYGGSSAVIGTIFDITDRKTAEEERERHLRGRLLEQERFSAVLSTTSDGFWIVDETNRITYTNDAYCRMSGYSREELLAMTIADLEAAEDPAVVDRHTDSIRRTGHDRFETRHRRKDGSVFDIEVTVNRFRGEGVVFSFIRDISERRRAAAETERLGREREQHLRERLAEQERFQSILAHANEGFWITSEQDRFLFVNDAYCRLMGWGRDELMQLTIGDIEMIMTPEQVEQHTRRIREDGHLIFETQHRRKDGVPVDLEVSVTFYRPERIFFSFFRDIRERKRSEEALRESELRFRQVSETAQEWIWEVDLNGQYTYASPVVTNILGYAPEDIVGKKCFYDFFLPEERDQLKRDAFAVFASRSRFQDFVNRNMHRDGREVILSTSGMPRLDSSGNLLGYRGVDVDITERIRAEHERKRLYEESVDHYQRLLDEQQRHQAEKEKILKDLHDGIGGLTTNINLLAELARKNDDLTAVRRSLATIADLSRESLAEIRGFIQSLDERELTWQAIAAEFRHLGTTIIEPHGIAFSIDVAVPGNRVVPSSTVAMNLYRIYKESLANIIKHARATAVEVRFSVNDGTALLDIRDNGIGIGDRRGTGRGLPNMRSRAGEIGGTLTMTGSGGTHIRLEVPIPEKYPIGTME